MSPCCGVQNSHRRGFTVVEVLVSVGIVSLLIAISLPAVQQSRERARNIACKSNLSQLGKGFHAFHATNNRFPSGNIWMTAEFVGYVESTKTPDGQWSAVFGCPVDNRSVSDKLFTPSYWENLGNLKGAKGWGFACISSSQSITDGLSNSACLSERLNPKWKDNPLNAEYDVRTDYHFVSRQWPDMTYQKEFAEDCRAATTVAKALFVSVGHVYTHVLPPNGKSCYNMTGYKDEGSRMLITTPSSHHSGGVNLLMCDGAVRWVSDSISEEVWMNIGSVAGGETDNDF